MNKDLCYALSTVIAFIFIVGTPILFIASSQDVFDDDPEIHEIWVKTKGNPFDDPSRYIKIINKKGKYVLGQYVDKDGKSIEIHNRYISFDILWLKNVYDKIN